MTAGLVVSMLTGGEDNRSAVIGDLIRREAGDDPLGYDGPAGHCRPNLRRSPGGRDHRVDVERAERPNYASDDLSSSNTAWIVR